jgi:hypothetical protein
VLGLLFVLVMLTAFGVLPGDWAGGWRAPILLVLLAGATVFTLADAGLIPKENRTSWRAWMTTWLDWGRLGRVGVVAVAIVGTLADLSGILGDPPASEAGQRELQETVDRSAEQTDQQLTNLDSDLSRTAEQTQRQLAEIDERVQDIQTDRGAAPNGSTDDPRAEIVRLTGSWSVEGFVAAVFDRQTDLVDLYLNSGMTAGTLHKNASAILFGFQGDMNGDPVALVQTFQANGYDLDEQLRDAYMAVDGEWLLMFDTALTPAGYTGGYWGGEFQGSLLFWIVTRAAYFGPSEQELATLEYLATEGGDCSVALSYLEESRDIVDPEPGAIDEGPYDRLHAVLDPACAA